MRVEKSEPGDKIVARAFGNGDVDGVCAPQDGASDRMAMMKEWIGLVVYRLTDKTNQARSYGRQE
jgi:hypothetical protein